MRGRPPLRRRVDDTGHRDDLVPAHHERPAFAVGAGDLGVDEHVLDLLRAARQPVAGPPPADDKAWELGPDAPTAPVDLAAQLDGPALQPQAVVLAHRHDAAAEVEAPGSGRGVEQLCERRRHRAPGLERAEEVLARGRMDPVEERQDLVPDQPPGRVRVGRIDPELDPALAAERLRLLAPERKQRPDHAVLAPGLDPLRVPARHEAVEDRLDLVARRMPRGAQAVWRAGA